MELATALAANPTPICTTSEGGLIGTITEWLITLMETIGGVGVALAIALESVFPPIPSEVILPLAGFTAARGTLSLPGAIIWATIGSLLGAWTLYGISRWVGLHRINRAADKIPGVSRKDVALDATLLGRAVEDEFAETRDSLLDADPVQWARVNGFDAGRVAAIRAVGR